MSNPSITSAPAAPTTDERLAAVEKRLAAIERRANDAARAASEAVWAQVFHDTIRGSAWLTNQTFSPGRWAVGYPYLYVLYRILNEMKPKRILDLGLGQTTRMIAQYAAANPDVEHIVIEALPEWIDFFQNGLAAEGFALPKNTRILHLDYGFEAFEGVKNVRVYKRFKMALRGKTFDFISIDGPLSGDLKEIGRVDVQKLIPDGLASSFAILYDDTQRDQDKRSLDMLVAKLKAAGLAPTVGRYSGAKDCHVVVSPDNAYLRSM